jgi:large subunit ribosomal protein L6
LASFTEQELVAEVEIPDKIQVLKENNTIIIKGKFGVVKRDFTRLPATIIVEDQKKIIIRPYGKRKKDHAITNTARSVIARMIKGAEIGFTYKLKTVFAHFPIAIKVKGKEVHIENFYGERSARVSRVVGEGTIVKVVGDDVLVQGPSLEDVSQTAANIEASTKVKGKDHRVFLDGLYIYSREEGAKE